MNIAIQPPANQPSDAIPIEDFVSTHPQQVGFTEAFLRFAVQVLDDALQRAEGTDLLPPLRYSFEEEVARQWVNDHPATLKPEKPSQRLGAPAVVLDAIIFDLRDQGESALARHRSNLSTLTREQRKDVVCRLHAIRARYPKITDRLIANLGD